MTRRLYLAHCAALATLSLSNQSVRAESSVSFPSTPFTLGVASGDPSHDGVVLWTRLAPAPLEPYGGLPPVIYDVDWQIAEDDAMRKVVAFGTAKATPQLGHSVHVEVAGLRPDRWYWYRFRAGDAESPLGRTRTMPDPNARPAQLRFAFASCQHYEQGLYTAYEQMAADQLDLVCHLGDYIYEDGPTAGQVRKHVGNELRTLTDYRIRLSQYRSDPLLHGMHAQCPWLVTLDDHEVENNWAADISQRAIDPTDFLIQRAAAFQAYYEMMPLRARSLPRGPHLDLYRQASFGQLAQFHVLDTRQYRTDQPNGDRESPLNDAAMSRQNSLLGATQRNWLHSQLLASTANWNILAQQVMMGLVGFARRDGDPLSYSMDQWPGCAYERMELMKFLNERRVPNPVVLTGDIHSNWVNDLRIDDRVATGSVVATEFVGTSLSSGGNGTDRPADLDALKANNPCVRYHNRERGYVRCTVTPERWQSDYVVVDDVTKPGGKSMTRATFVVESGQPGAKEG